MSSEKPASMEITARLRTEDALSRLHEIEHSPHHASEQSARAQEIIHHTSEGTEYDRHEQGKALTLEHIGASAALAMQKLAEMLPETSGASDEEEHKAILAKRTLLSSRMSEIRQAAKRYAESVEKFSHISRRKSRMSSADERDAYQRADRERRNNHERLIEALRSYNAAIRWCADERYLEGVKVVEWRSGLPVPSPQNLKRMPSPVVFVFPETFLSDRDAIKDWGIAEVFRQSAAHIAEAAQAKRKGPVA